MIPEETAHLKPGSAIHYVDVAGVQHRALVTAVHGPELVNLVYVAPTLSDPNVGSVHQPTSVSHRNASEDAGHTWHGEFETHHHVPAPAAA